MGTPVNTAIKQASTSEIIKNLVFFILFSHMNSHKNEGHYDRYYPWECFVSAR